MQENSITFAWHQSLDSMSADAWQALSGKHPFLQYQLLNAFEKSEAVDSETGWQTCHLAAYQAGQLLAAMPLYLKAHSYGEYVFDWAWADAYARAGGHYYPKLISAIPFSPVTGPRLLIHPKVSQPDVLAAQMLAQIEQFCHQQQVSGAHILFPAIADAGFCQQNGWMRREGVQFRWRNDDYLDWDAFLNTLSHDKRKKIKQERKKVSQQGVTCRRLSGHAIDGEVWALFYQCYCQTYYAHGSQPYLPVGFFEHLSQYMPDNLTLFVAMQDGKDIACSLCVHDDETLYGRYWGALAQVSCLHFELCYYQPQQFCIEQKIRYFEGGAQGVHKLARGFDPYPTCSYHWLRDPAFSQAVSVFLQREQGMMAAYVNELEERRPYKLDADHHGID